MVFNPAFLEFIGTTEMLVIAVVALIIFGPRKLPEIGRTIGKSLAEFKRTSEDFKRTWEREVEFERIERDLRMPDINVEARPITPSIGGSGRGRDESAATEGRQTAEALPSESAPAATAAGDGRPGEESEPPLKHDWL